MAAGDLNFQDVATPTVRLPGEHAFEANGIKFTYTISGKGPLLVVQVPGWGVGASYLRHTLVSLEQYFSLLYFEPRGNGHSSRPENEEAMSSEHMAIDLEQLRLHLGLQTLMLLGHSNGGCIALGYAARFPERVSKLVLLDHQLMGFRDPESWERFKRARIQDPVYGPALRSIRKNGDQ
ncbi:hypothetical protein BZG36_05322 [Bifiguratus adelaidae]|uniref:AB hydrolase-1 domain-containing protein n=1 Tax=Bifiguratus adelaidae TaxID=1938954 RepID=A0A261XU77_9FUNG|nr:hypothetical protein BZG36_05322 [Bifiguratus adelaidae]